MNIKKISKRLVDLGEGSIVSKIKQHLKDGHKTTAKDKRDETEQKGKEATIPQLKLAVIRTLRVELDTIVDEDWINSHLKTILNKEGIYTSKYSGNLLDALEAVKVSLKTIENSFVKEFKKEEKENKQTEKKEKPEKKEKEAEVEEDEEDVDYDIDMENEEITEE